MGAMTTGTATRLIGGVGGAVLLTVVSSPVLAFDRAAPMWPGFGIGGVWSLAVVFVATVAGLSLIRFWPWLLFVSALLEVVPVLAESRGWVLVSAALFDVVQVGGMLALIGVLGCAQGLANRQGESIGWGSVMAGLSAGAVVLGAGIRGASSKPLPYGLRTVHLIMLAVVVLALIPALRVRERPAPGTRWQRMRLPLIGTLATLAWLPLPALSLARAGGLLGNGWTGTFLQPIRFGGLAAAILLLVLIPLVAASGPWSLGGALTSAVVHIAAVAPLVIATTTVAAVGPAGWIGALAGVVVGVAVLASRRRMPYAAALAAGAAATLFIMYWGTGGQPENLFIEYHVVPGTLILVVVAAAITAVTGATVPGLAPEGAIPVALGPLAAMLGIAGLRFVTALYGDGDSDAATTSVDLNTSAILLLLAAAGIAGLAVARQLVARHAERLRIEQVRLEAAAAERDRLARPIHDGVLQVLALVQRHSQGTRLAELASEQDVALRGLLAGHTGNGSGPESADLRTALMSLASPAIEVAAPAGEVTLPSHASAELTAAVRAALDNVRRHAGPGARAWILLEDEHDGVRVTVRDDGAGFAPDRLAEAEAAGRLGVAQSMRGRLADLGGTTTIHSAPGEGTEIEFWVPVD